MSTIGIEWLSGRPHNRPEDDEERAADAAQAVFDDAGADPAEADAEYMRQWAEFDDEAPMTGLALIWIKARDAADLAATEGWHNPNGAHVTIVCT
jgi:hypothetical protein